MKKHIISVLTLVCICAIVSLALAVCYGITNPIILERLEKAAFESLPEVLPGTTANDFSKVDMTKYQLPASIKQAYSAGSHGYVLQVEFSGFNPGNVAMIGVSAEGKVTGTKVITNTESSGYGADHLPVLDSKGHYNGFDASTIDGVDTVAGCTVSTKAYRAAVKDALNAALILGGATVDLRTPEKILSDNLNTALGTTDVEFDKLVLTDDITGVDEIYAAKNGAGHVAVIADTYIGINAEGAFVAAVDAKTNPVTAADEDKVAAENAVASVKNVTYTDIDLTQYANLPAGIKSAQVSNKGVYVIVVEFEGYKPGNSAEITIDKDGKVIGTKALVINDTPTFGGEKIPALDAAGHFNGATVDSIDGVDTVAGCTVSTKAYRSAIKDALVAVTMFSGGSYVDPFTASLNTALGTSGVEFEKHFFTQVVVGVDAVYTAKTGEGYVCIIGDTMVGVDANGNVVGGTNEVAATAVAKIMSTTYTEFNPKDYGASNRVKSAMITNDGVYVLEVEGSGFGKKGDAHYGASGEYILIRIALTADGNIVDCYTIYQSESTGFGDVCGTEEFYSQFAGLTKDNYEDVVIAGSTYTTDGYHGAIKNAFKAVEKFVAGGVI